MSGKENFVSPSDGKRRLSYPTSASVDAPPSDGDFEIGFIVGGAVAADVFRLPEQGARELVLAWDASPLGDVVADAVVCLALHSEAYGTERKPSLDARRGNAHSPKR